jgi:hypothetical protein
MVTVFHWVCFGDLRNKETPIESSLWECRGASDNPRPHAAIVAQEKPLTWSQFALPRKFPRAKHAYVC